MGGRWLVFLVLACDACDQGPAANPIVDAGLADAADPDGSEPDAAADPDGSSVVDAAAPDAAPPDVMPPDASVDLCAIATAPITVTGVVHGIFGYPAAGVRVGILDRDDVVVTDETGTFTFSDVAVPYQLVLLDDADERYFVYDGLCRANLRVAVGPLVYDRMALERHGYVTGTASPGFPTTGNAEGVAITPNMISTHPLQPSSGDVYFDDLRWHGDVETVVSIHVLHWTKATNDLPATYHGYGVLGGIVVHDGELTSGVSLALGAVSQGNVTARGSVPAAYGSPAISAYARFDDGGVITLGGGVTNPVTFAAPLLPDGLVAVRVNASAGGSAVYGTYYGARPGDDVTITVPPPPELLAPADGAVDVAAGTVFSWRRYPGVHLLMLVRIGGTPPGVVVWTHDASAALPDLARYGVTLPSDANYGWTVSGLSPPGTIDELTDPDRLAPTGGTTVYEANSLARVFTTL